MSDTDQAHEAVERLDYLERDESRTPGFDRRAFLRRTALTGVAAGSVSSLLAACGSSASSSSAASSIFGTSTSYKFTFVNHVTTNPFFVPTQYGIQDACKLLGCTYAWTGSETSNVSQMVNAVNSAVSAGADGIAVSLIDPTAFNAPVAVGAERRDPGRRLQRRRARQPAPGLHRPGPVRLGRKDGRTHRGTRALGRSRAVHRDPRLAQHPAADRRRAEDAQKTPCDHDARDRHRRRGSRASSR